MTDQPALATFFTPRQHRWLTALLILATLAAAFVAIDYVGKWYAFFSDVIIIFFLAWLLAFILSPVANGLLRLFPRLPRAIAVIVVYTLLIAILFVVALQVATSLYNSISTLVNNWPTDARLREILQPWQDRLNSVGGSQINLYDQVKSLLANLKSGANGLVKPLGDIAFASIGVMGNLLFVFFLSLYMAVDRDHIVSFLFRLVPPAYTDEASLLEHSIARSFGGFLRGQALTGVLYGAVAAAASAVLGLPYMPVTTASSGILQAIPFFGPFISWMPPVLMAIFFKPEAVLPTFAIMIAGWFVVMNVIQPRLMANAVGLHPVVVLGSVLIGTKIAGIPGAIFAIPVAAVISAFFFYYLGQHQGDAATVAERAARRVEEREGRPIRVPRLPQAGEDADVETAVDATTRLPPRSSAARGKGGAPRTGPGAKPAP
jgi:predicted PurR-regulated permease PerM